MTSVTVSGAMRRMPPTANTRRRTNGTFANRYPSKAAAREKRPIRVVAVTMRMPRGVDSTRISAGL